MGKAEAVEQFKNEVLPFVVAQYGWDDIPAQDQAWNDWTDGLCKDGEITERQYSTWSSPTPFKEPTRWIRQ